MYIKNIYKYRNIFACLIVFVLLGSMFMSAAPAVAEELSVEEMQPIGDAGNEQVMPLALEFTPAWYATTAAATLTYSPHPGISAATPYTVPAGGGVWLLGRTYDCYYVHYEVPNGKVIRGYIPISVLNPTSYIWIDYDVFRPATCTATTQVISGPGTTNTYYATGEIYANENPLMVLGTEVNPYNNVTYYYVQYQTSSGLVKRGWIDPRGGTVTWQKVFSHYVLPTSNTYYSFINRSTGKALTWNTASDQLSQHPFTGATNQTFYLERVYYTVDSGYFKIVSAYNPNMAITVTSTGYADGLSLVMSEKGHPHKRQEFRFDLVGSNDPATNEDDDDSLNLKQYYFSIKSRITGEFRSLEIYEPTGGIIQSQYTGAFDQNWTLLQIGDLWGGTYGQGNGGAASPGNYQVYVDDSVKSFYTDAVVQECLDRWNAVYSDRFSLSVTTNNVLSNRLKITAGIPQNKNVLGKANPKISSNGSFIDAETGANWNFCEIELYLENLYKYTSEQKKVNLLHELGHAFKLSHTYEELRYIDNTLDWFTRRQGKSVMDQGVNLPSNPTTLDTFRLKQKWSSVS